MTENNVCTTAERNYGIDLLRIISMMLVVLLHVLGQGGLLGFADLTSVRGSVIWMLEIAAYCAVNIYALISGYVGYGHRYKYSGIFSLYFQVIFYTILTTVIFYKFKPDLVYLKYGTEPIFPFAYSTYWYYTAYFCMSFFIPFLNMILEKIDRKTWDKIFLLLYLVFSILPMIFFNDFGHTSNGYSFLWITILYLVGGYIKKYEDELSTGRKVKYLLGYILCVLVTWISKMGIYHHFPQGKGDPEWSNMLIKYTSPTIILCAVCLLMFFKDIRCHKMVKTGVRYFSPASFGVYLFHQEPLIRDTFLANMFAGYMIFGTGKMVFAILVSVVGIWLLGSLIDRIRINLFDLFRVNKLCALLGNKFQNGIDNLR